MCFGVAYYLFETMVHHILQAFVHFAFAPEKSLAILHPFEITHRNTARIPQNVRDDKNSLTLDNGIRMRGRRPIGSFAKDLAVHARGILRRNLIFGSGWYQNIAGMEQNLLRRHFGSTARKLRQRFSLAVHPVDYLWNIEPFFVIEAAVNVRDAYNLLPSLRNHIPALPAHL